MLPGLHRPMFFADLLDPAHDFARMAQQMAAPGVVRWEEKMKLAPFKMRFVVGLIGIEDL